MAGLTERNGTWYATWKKNGLTSKKSTGIPVGSGKVEQKKNRQLAEQVAAQMENVAKGGNVDKAVEAIRGVAEGQGMVTKTPTVREYLLSVPATSSESSERNRRRAFRLFLDYLGSDADKRLDTVIYNTCRDFIRAQLRELSKGSVCQYHVYLSRAFADAQDIHGYITRNPMRPVSVAQEAKQMFPETGGKDKQEREPFTPEEMHRLLTEAPRPWRHIVAVSYYLGGLRLGDTCLMKWENIDLERGNVTFTEQKTKAQRDIPIVPALREVLHQIWTEQGGKEEYLFPVQAHLFNSGSNGYVSTGFTSILQALGIITPSTDKMTGRRKRISSKSFHSIRHTVVSMLRVNTAFTPDTVRDTVGHASEEVERGYFHGNRKQREAVLNALADSVQIAAAMPSYDTRTA